MLPLHLYVTLLLVKANDHTWSSVICTGPRWTITGKAGTDLVFSLKHNFFLVYGRYNQPKHLFSFPITYLGFIPIRSTQHSCGKDKCWFKNQIHSRDGEEAFQNTLASSSHSGSIFSSSLKWQSVSWDFWTPILTHLGPFFICWSTFANSFDFAEIFACAKYSVVSMSNDTAK